MPELHNFEKIFKKFQFKILIINFCKKIKNFEEHLQVVNNFNKIQNFRQNTIKECHSYFCSKLFPLRNARSKHAFSHFNDRIWRFYIPVCGTTSPKWGEFFSPLLESRLLNRSLESRFFFAVLSMNDIFCSTFSDSTIMLEGGGGIDIFDRLQL